MYTIKEASHRTGVAIPLLRAWERRYGIVKPTRTDAGYRLYDEAAIGRLRAMRSLVLAGWSPRQAADHVLSEPDPPTATDVAGSQPPGRVSLVDAAARVDAAGIERVLDDIFAGGSFERVVEARLYPALVALGAAWERGDVDVSGEHVASSAVHRRLGMAFEAAGRSSTRAEVVVGLPAGARHELPALAFATALRRAGLETTYLGSDVPIESWLNAMTESGGRAAVVGVPTADDLATARLTMETLRAAQPRLVLAAGGRHAPDLPDGLAEVLPDGLEDAVQRIRALLARA